MKSTAYFALLFLLLNSAAWSQSARRTHAPMMLSCTGLSCSVSSASRRAPDVTLGAFTSFSHAGIRTAKTQVNLGTFRSIPTQHSALRMVNYEVKLGTFKSPVTSPHIVLAKLHN